MNQSGCSCAKKQEWCDDPATYNQFKTITEGLSDFFTIGPSSPSTVVRFQLEKPCIGIHLKVVSTYGEVNTYLNPELDQLRQNMVPYPELSICPKDFYYRYGTYGFSVYPRQGQMCKLQFQLEFFEMPNESLPITPMQRCSDSQGYWCPQMNHVNGPLSGFKLMPSLMKMTITECTHLYLHREMTKSSLNITGEMGVGIATQIPVLNPQGYHLVSPFTFVFGVCPPPGTESVTLIVSLVNLSVDFEMLLTFSTDSSRWRMRELSSYSFPDLFGGLVGAFDVQCGDQLFTCRKGAFDWYTSCLEAWVVVPAVETTGLWPCPEYLLLQEAQTFSALPVEFSSEVTDMKVSGGLWLELVTENEIIRPFPSWRTDLESNCTIMFPNLSSLTTKDGIPVLGKYPFRNRTEPICDYQSFVNISAQLETLSISLSQQTESSAIIAARYMLDTQTFTPTWIGCKFEIERKYLEAVEKEVTFYNTTGCPPNLLDGSAQSQEDPCCNSDISWTTCCQERNITYPQQSLAVPRQMNNDDFCGNADCLKPLLEDYVFYSNLRDSLTGCSTAIQETIGLKEFRIFQPYRNCKELIFGSNDGSGRLCFSDSDCWVNQNKVGGKCDHHINKCIFPSGDDLQQAYTWFFQCLEDNLDSAVKDYLSEIVNNSTSLRHLQEKQSLAEQMANHYVIDECVDMFGRSTMSARIRIQSVSASACPACDYSCFDSFCLPDWRCERHQAYGRPGSVCLYIQRYFPSEQQLCTDARICNWNSSISDPFECDPSLSNSSSSQTNTSFCGLCESPTSCQTVPIFSAEECQQTTGCLVGEKVVFNLTQDECEALGICSISCPDCQTQEGCENAGYCTDREIEDYLEFSAPYYQAEPPSKELVINSSGYCLFEINPWNNPDCVDSTQHSSIDIPTPLGCLSYQSDEPSCSTLGEWHSYSDDQEECESRTACIEPTVLTNMRTPKDPTQCELCQGTSVPVYQWQHGIWRKGTPLSFGWIKKEWVASHRWEPTIDFLGLSYDIEEAVSQQYSFQLQTEAHCRLNPTKNVMNKILCFCSSSNQEECLVSNGDLGIGVGFVCAGQLYTLVAPPSVIQFTNSSFSVGCAQVEINTILMSDIQKPPKSSISTSFRSRRKAVDSVRNEQGVYVGKLLGNGISLSFSETDPLLNFSLCIMVDSEATSDSEYPETHFGVKLSRTDIRPLHIEVVRTSDSLCGWIELSQLPSLDIYPVATRKNWEQEDDGLTTKETVIFSIMFALYAILFLWKTYEEISYGFKDLKPSRWIAILVIGCLFVRMVYFIFFLADKISSTDDSLSEFLLVEIPTYLYFLAICVTAILWSSASKLQNLRETIKSLVLNFTYILLVALAFLVAIVVAWKLSGESGSYKCGGTVYVEPNDSTRQTIRLIYRIIVSVATLVICLCLSFYAIKIYLALDENVAGTPANEKFQKKILLVGWASTLSLLGQCIFFICYSALVDPSCEWSLFLILLEWIPMAFICVVLGSSKLSNKLTSVSSSSAGKSGRESSV